MNTAKKQELDIESYWKTFASEEGLSSENPSSLRDERVSVPGERMSKLEQFKKYHALLTEWNEKINLTAITDPQEIITYHFRDSLAVDRFIDFKQLHMISDVGTGGGFPGIPLKIKYPHLKLVLIEVIQKKINFLQEVVDQLGLEGVEMCSMDWRNFLRHTDYPIDLFVSRASLRPEDLMYMFKGASPYQDKNIVYWASQIWEPSKKEEQYIQQVHSYVVGKNRKLVVLAKPFESSKTEQ